MLELLEFPSPKSSSDTDETEFDLELFESSSFSTSMIPSSWFKVFNVFVETL